MLDAIISVRYDFFIPLNSEKVINFHRLKKLFWMHKKDIIITMLILYSFYVLNNFSSLIPNQSGIFSY